MKFDELDQMMRVFETAQDLCVLPEMFIVARIDSRNFTRLTRETHQFTAPFDERFRDLMVETTAHLMNCGFRVIYGYTQSDEISLLFRCRCCLKSMARRRLSASARTSKPAWLKCLRRSSSASVCWQSISRWASRS